MLENESIDKALCQMIDPLEGPSMSAEYFDTLGLIICGLNSRNKMTEVHIFDTN